MSIRLFLVVAAALATSACNWITLATNAIGYRIIERGEAANLAALDTLIYVTRAQDGLAILGVRSGEVLGVVLPPEGSGSIDDLALADNLLFALDARAPGQLSVYSLENPLRPRLVSPPRRVPVEPFAGVSCGHGRCLVSGGTSELTVWHYDRGILSGPVATADLGRGQPDVLLAPNARLAFVSAHYWGPHFGLDVLSLDGEGRRLDKLAELKLEGAGFTEGGAKPANFPIQAALLGDDTVLVAAGRGLAVVSVLAPSRPLVLQLLDVGGPAVSVATQGRAALVAVGGREPSLVIVDFSRARVRIARRIPLLPGTRPTGVVLTRSHAVVAAGALGVMVFER